MPSKNAAALWVVAVLTGVAVISWVAGPPTETQAGSARAEASANPVQFDTLRMQRLQCSPAREWTDDDVEHIKALSEADLPVAGRDALAFEPFAKWYHYDHGSVTRNEQQAIAERIAAKLPDESTAHMVAVEGWDGSLTV